MPQINKILNALVFTSALLLCHIGEAQPLIIDIESKTDVSCFGGNDGSATARAMYGVPPYSFKWSDGQTGKTASNLSAGFYTCTVTDIQMASAFTVVTIDEPTELKADVFGVTHINCDNDFWLGHALYKRRNATVYHIMESWWHWYFG